MELTGTVETIIYRNADNGYTVLELVTEDGTPITAVGSLALCNPGERVQLTGLFSSHPKYGNQFKAEKCTTLAPATEQAIETYLGSGLIKGIGASTAKQIVFKFGMDALDILDNEPERLTEISGIGPKKAAQIAMSYREHRDMRDILLALEPYGVTVGQAMKLYSIYGNLCLAKIQENPYRMIEDVDGIGFITADKIAQNIPDFSEDSQNRIKAGLFYAMNVARNEYGHTCLPKQSLISYTEKLLGVSQEALSECLDSMIGKGTFVYRMVGDSDMVFLPWLVRTEKEIAEKLVHLSENQITNAFLALSLEQSSSQKFLSEQQKHAVQTALEHGLLVITGGPGTGKTTIIRCITEILQDMQMEFALCAPTGRAAKRMSEATDCDASTIHRLLEYIPGEGFIRNEENPLLYDMIIMDEVSMVDVPLFHAFLKAVPNSTQLILVGDSDQLPPVGCGDVLNDMIESKQIPVVRLTEIFRQSKRSHIVLNAHKVNNGEMPDLEDRETDFLFEQIDSQDAVLNRVMDLCKNPGEVLETREPLMDIQVLVPMKKGTLGVKNINIALQQALNPASPSKKEYRIGERLFREGDKVMQMQNDYKISWTKQEASGKLTEGTGAFNGDLGTVFKIEPSVKLMTILFDDGRLAIYEPDQMEALDLAYCISIHKSQGSEFPIVILPLCGGPPMLMTRNLLYTAITRARGRVCCLGRKETIREMVQNNRSTRRYTSLCEQIKELQYLRGI